jgi:hypothetical protein
METEGMVVLMALPLFLILLAAGGALQGTAYTYDLKITIYDGNQTLSPDQPSSPYSLLLNETLFLNDSTQTSILESVSLNGFPVNYSLVNDADGNPSIEIPENTPLEPGANATLELSFEIYVSNMQINLSGIGNLSDIPSSLVQQYPMTGSWNLTGVDDAQAIYSTAQSLKGNDENVLSIVYNILGWFENNMVYNSSLPYPRTVSETFETHMGDCDDQANLFITYCRILGIPAYLSVGPIYLVGNNLEDYGNLQFNLTNVGWHAWAMVYLPKIGGGGEWVPVDLTFFGVPPDSEGHIKSQDPSQHIIDSALAYYGAVVLSNFKTTDYVGDSVYQWNALQGANITWSETDSMMLQTKATSNTSPALLVATLTLAILGLVAIFIMALRPRLRKVPDEQPPPTASVTLEAAEL